MNTFFKCNTWILFMLVVANTVLGQNNNTENISQLKNSLSISNETIEKVILLNKIADTYKYSDANEGLKYSKTALDLSQKNNWQHESANALVLMGTCHQTLKDYEQALYHFQKALSLYEELSKTYEIATTNKNIALVYLSQKKYADALLYFEKTVKKFKLLNDKTQIIYSLNDIANVYFIQENYSKAKEYYNQSILINKEIKDNNGYAYCLSQLGEISLKEKETTKAVYYFKKASETYDKNQKENLNNVLKKLSISYSILSKTDYKNKEAYASLSQKTFKSVKSTAKDEFSQSIESLKESLLTTKSDTLKINILNTIASKYFYSNPKVGITYCRQALAISKKINWNKGMAVSNEFCGVCQWVLTDYSKALNHFFTSLHYYETLKDTNGIAGIYNNLGLIYGKLKNYPKALHYLNLAYNTNAKSGNSVLMVYNLNNIGSTFLEQGKLKESLHYFNLSQKLNETMNDINGLGYVYTNFGKIYSKQKQYVKAIDFYNKALKNYDDSQNYNRGIVYIEMGNTYFEMAKNNLNPNKEYLNKSKESVLKAYAIFYKIGALDKINECHFMLYQNLKFAGDYKNAFSYYEKYTMLKDSILLNESSNKLLNLETQREIEIKDKKIKIQNLKMETDSRKVEFLVIITATIALLVILFFYLYIIKRSTNDLLIEKNETISNINKQKDKFFSIIAHDLRGPFNGFLGLTELLAEDIDSMDNEEIQFAASNMRSSAKNLNQLLENLLEWSRMEQGLLPFNPEQLQLLPLTLECVDTLNDSTDKKGITIKNLINEKTTVFADANLAKAVIRNILSNAVKFTPTGGTIMIQGKEDETSTTIAIKDSGIGMNEKMLGNLFKLDVKNNRKGTEDEPSSGLGLILCKEFIEKHGGHIWAESQENIGTSFYFSFPKKDIIPTI